MGGRGAAERGGQVECRRAIMGPVHTCTAGVPVICSGCDSGKVGQSAGTARTRATHAQDGTPCSAKQPGELLRCIVPARANHL